MVSLRVIARTLGFRKYLKKTFSSTEKVQDDIFYFWVWAIEIVFLSQKILQFMNHSYNLFSLLLNYLTYIVQWTKMAFICFFRLFGNTFIPIMIMFWMNDSIFLESYSYPIDSTVHICIHQTGEKKEDWESFLKSLGRVLYYEFFFYLLTAAVLLEFFRMTILYRNVWIR